MGTRLTMLALSGSLLGCGPSQAQPASSAAPADAREAEESPPPADGKATIEEETSTAEGVQSSAEEVQTVAEPQDANTVGIPVCDTYITEYGRCIEESAPESVRAMMLEALEKTRLQFIAARDDPERRDSLTQVCQVALETVRKTSREWGCSF